MANYLNQDKALYIMKSKRGDINWFAVSIVVVVIVLVIALSILINTQGGFETALRSLGGSKYD